MGKSKSSKTSKKQAASAAKCTCDHPFQCSCGNRPERPSRGHKWDPETQQWGGKGHKQKGASGQTASISQPKKTLSSGTSLSQWEKLPSQLLDQVCQKQGRPRAKYKSIGNNKYRVIVQDAKVSRRGTDHDLFFVPKSSAKTEESAKEEAALLALLHMTPTLPHERKLPEPYKTTWLRAVEASKQSKSDTATAGSALESRDNAKRSNKSTSNQSSKQTNTQSSSSEPLAMASSFASAAERKRHHDAKRQERNARIRRHEAIRLANRDHPVFLSANCRQQIESLLRGDMNIVISEEYEEEEDGDDTNEVKTYVVQRLHSEGFTVSQARTAFSQLTHETIQDESEWDTVYEECLQWLCIHLDESQLPEGFDPRGLTLDVVVAPVASAGGAKSGESGTSNPKAAGLVTKYGISEQDAILVLGKSSGDLSVENVLWTDACQQSGAVLDQDKDYSDPTTTLDEEIETLQAIFSFEECSIRREEGMTTIQITIPSDNGDGFALEIVLKDQTYPMSFPERVLLSGSWPSSNGVGSAIHIELAKFVATLTKGEPMVYEIYGRAMSLIHAAQDGNIQPVSLISALSGKGSTSTSNNDNSSNRTQNSPKKGEVGTKAASPRPRNVRRPREKSFFWFKTPKQTPAATAFPKINATLERQRKSLPAAKARDDILSVMKQGYEGGRVVLVTGDTGSGKTTQVPAFILENAPQDAKIVVAQPRRLAATGVANRVANERGESEPGTGSVGYIVRGDVAICKSTRLLFCTTGVLLRQLQSDNALDCITHIVVDEVHERNLDTDVLLGVLKGCLKTTPHLRVVLMSATLDADRFAQYWGSSTPRVHIPGRTFPVTDFMLEDVLALSGYIPRKNSKKKNGYNRYNGARKRSAWDDSEKSDDEADETPDDDNAEDSSWSHNIPIEELVARVDESRIDNDMIGHLVKHLVQGKSSSDDGSILVFLPGAPKINKAMDAIRKVVGGLPVQLLPLHGGLQPKQQNLVFQPAGRGITKVILSTNVAETSITIPDCTIVIDSCREKQSSYDPSNRMPLLVEKFTAKANAKQRRGRAGRVREGTCYKLISRKTYESLPDHGEPEIRRCALDQTLLSLMFIGVERGSGNFLQTLLDPPSKASIDAAIFSLQRLGAVTTGEGDLSLTPLGLHLAGIPAPPTVGKMLMMGSILGCRSAALAMAAAMSVGRSPFLRIDNRQTNQNVREESMEDFKRRTMLEERNSLFKSVGNSDHAMVAAAYMNWDSIRTGASDRKKFCEKLGLSFNGMRDMKQLVKQLDSSLASLGYTATSDSDRNTKSWRIVRACATAALAPSQLVRVHRPVTKYAETAEGAVEKDGIAKELKFFVRVDPTNQEQQVDEKQKDERVFMHPSSFNFATGNYSCPWLVYHELVRTSKAFLRDATECSAYSLLLFGGKMQVEASKGLIVIDDWVRLAANARIGALIGGMRRKLNELLAKKVEDPSFDLCNAVEMKLIVSLLISDGLGS